MTSKFTDVRGDLNADSADALVSYRRRGKGEGRKESGGDCLLFISLVATGLALVSYGVPVAVKYGVESMSNGEHGAVSELCAYCRLDQLVCLHVDGSRRFVQHQDGSLAQQSSRQTDQLTLTHATTRTHARTHAHSGARTISNWD